MQQEIVRVRRIQSNRKMSGTLSWRVERARESTWRQLDPYHQKLKSPCLLRLKSSSASSTYMANLVFIPRYLYSFCFYQFCVLHRNFLNTPTYSLWIFLLYSHMGSIWQFLALLLWGGLKGKVLENVSGNWTRTFAFSHTAPLENSRKRCGVQCMSESSLSDGDDTEAELCLEWKQRIVVSFHISDIPYGDVQCDSQTKVPDR